MERLNKAPKSKNRKKFFIGSVLLIIIIALIILVLEKANVTDFIKNPSSSSEREKTEQATINDTTRQTKDDVEIIEGVDSNKSIDEIPESTTTVISLSSLTQNSSNVQISAVIENPGETGVCSFTFTKDGAKPIVRSVNTTNSECTTSIPIEEFEMIGPWNIAARYFANNTQISTSGSIDIR